MFNRALLLLIAAASLSWSASLDPSLLPADSQWLMHLDARALMQGKLGEVIRQEVARRNDARVKIDLFTNITGTNLLADIDGITVAGVDANEASAICWTTGKFDAAKLTTLVANANDYKSTSYGDSLVHRWKDDASDHFGCLIRDGLLIYTKNEAAMQTAINVAKGNRPAMPSNGELLKALPNLSAPFLIAAASGIGDWQQAQAQSEIAKQMRFLGMSFGESGDSVAGAMQAIALDETTAQKLRDVAQGLLALGALSQNPDLAEHLRTVKIEQNQDHVLVNFSVSIAAIQANVDKHRTAEEK